MSVLIETYWNVNTGGKGSRCGTAVGINRNILECKSLLDSQRPHQENRVLIETYWNVNCRQGDKAARDVLIGINRNILECKLMTPAVSSAAFPGINRNILECKGLKNLSMQQGVRY